MSSETTAHGHTTDPCSNCLRHGSCLGDVIQHAQPRQSTCVSVVTLQRGQSLHRVGDATGEVYVVQSGALKSRRVSVDGNEEIVAFRLPGDTVGLDDIGRTRRGTDALALCTTRVCRLPLETVQTEAQRSGPVADHLFKDLGHEFARLHERLQNERRAAPARIAHFLLTQLERRQRLFGTDIDRYTLPMTRIDLGRFLGMATETVSRIFTRLQAEGAIACDGQTVIVRDIEALRRHADEQGADRGAMARAA